MNSFLLFPKEVLRFATSDLLLNAGNIVTAITREERDYSLIEISVGTKDLVTIKFNNPQTRDAFFKFIIDECKPKLGPAVSVEDTKPEKKRRVATRD